MDGSMLKKLLRTIFVTGLAFALNYLISLILTPYITDHVGTDAYGYVTLARTCTQYATILTMALNSFSARYITLEFHNGNSEKANTYYSSVFWGNLIIGSAVLVLALLATAFLEKILVISPLLLGDVKLLFALVFLSFWITTVFTVYSNVPYVCNRLDTAGIFKGLSYLAEAIVLVVMYALLPKHVWYVGIGLTAAALVIALSGLWMNKRYVPALKVSRSKLSWRAVKQLILDGIWSSANYLGNMLNSGLDLVICNLMLTPLAMGQVAIVKTMDNLFHALYQLVGQAFQPMFLKSYADGNREKLLGELKFSMKVSGMLSNIIFAGFGALGLVYYQLWIPKQDTELIYGLTMVTILASVASGPMSPLYYIYTLTLKKEFPCIVTIIGGICNVLAMYLGIRFFHANVYIVVTTTTVVMLTINLITNPLYMARVLQLPWHTFYPGIVRNLISCGALLALYIGARQIYLPHSWLGLIACAMVYGIIGIPVHFLITGEKQDLDMFKKLIKR